MVENGLGDIDTTGFSQRLEPRCDVDPVAIEVAALNHHVAEIDPDAQDDSPILGNVAVGDVHRLLQIHRAGNCVDGAGKLYQHAIPHQLDDAAMMFGNCWLKNLSTPGFERSQGAGLVMLHEAAVADYVGGQNGGKATLNALFGHMTRLPSKSEVQRIV